MAHNITDRDGFFTVRQPAWHGLGEVLPDYPTREEAQAIAHPWEPVSEPVYRRVPTVDAEGNLQSAYELIEDQQAIVRSDTDTVLGVQSSTWEPVSNSVLYDIAEAIEGESKGSVMYETGGSLKGGRKVWLLIRLRDPLMINGDPNGAVIPYFSLQNAHDGSASFRGQATMTRIVCDNTAQWADMDAHQRGTEFTFRHTASINDRIEQAREALAGWQESVGEYHRMMEHMVDVEVNVSQQQWFIETFIPMPPAKVVSDRVAANVEKGRQDLLGILRGATTEGVGMTTYGLFQGAVEYGQHYRKARTQETRFKRSYIDSSVLNADALNLAQQAALV